ncbi:MAG: GNAT family N-acetyltransferase, partial [Pseudomonadota bacterium]|nr:GNAT family N-acetyltransferase [Pseudomonadota bacterium]
MSELAINSRKAARDNFAAIISLLADDDIGQSREVVSDPPDVRCVDASDAINRDEDQLLVVAEESNNVLGCLQLTFIPGLPRTGMWRGQIESVRTARSKRGSGL